MNPFIAKFISIASYINTDIQRFIDHSWRRLTGMPRLARSEITPNLYLGGQYYYRGVHTLQRIGITAIVNMRLSPAHQFKGMEHIIILHLPTPDLTAPTIEHLEKGIEFIQNEIDKGGKVYIHCHAGEGRGPTMVIAYLMSTGMLYEEAYNLVKKIRTFIRLTKPQIKQLAKLETILQEKISKKIS